MRRGTLLATVLALCLLAPPALAASWERVADPAPAGSGPSLAVLAGVPYLASVSPSGVLTVSRGGSAWTQVGGPINHDPAAPAVQPDLVATGSTLWVTWVEAGQIRVSKLVSGQWHEAVGGARPINRSGTTGSRPRMVVRSGVPYIAYTAAGADVRLDVVQLDGGKFRHITTGLSTAEGIRSDLTTLGNALYIAYNQGDFNRVSRLNDAESRWVTVSKVDGDFWFNDFVDGSGSVWYTDGLGIHRVTPDGVVTLEPPAPVAGPDSIAIVSGVRYAAGIYQTLDFVAGEMLLAVFRGGAWQSLPSPADPGSYTTHVQLTRAGSALWITWIETDGDEDTPRPIHVARFVP
jgi:hypothetical protein